MNRKQLCDQIDDIRNRQMQARIIFTKEDIIDINELPISTSYYYGYLDRYSKDPDNPSIIINGVGRYADYLYNQNSLLYYHRGNGPSMMISNLNYHSFYKTGYKDVWINNNVRLGNVEKWFEEMGWNYEDLLDTEEKLTMFKLKYL